MKKRNIILMALLIVVVVGVVVFVITKLGTQPVSTMSGESTVDIKPEDPLSEPGTIYVDKEKKIAATIGVEKADSELDEEEPKKTEPVKGSEKSEPTEGSEKSEPKEGSEKTEPTEGSEKTEPTEGSEKSEPTPTPAPMPEEPAKSSYEQFIALSSEQKDEFMHSFESMDAFFDWLTAAQEEYKNAHPEIEIGPGDIIDLGELIP